MARRAGVVLGLALSAHLCGCGWLPGFVRHSGDESTRLTDEARKACGSGDHEHARQLLKRAAEVAPDDPEIQRKIGQALLLSGETDEGLKHLRYATRHGVDDPDVYLELARVLMDAGKYDECEEMIDATLRLVPSHEQAQLMEGRLSELRRNDDEALAVYYRLLASDPSSAEAILRVSALLVRMDRSSQAAPLLRSIVDSDRISTDQQARVHWSLGLIYGHDRRWAESAAQLAAAAALQPDRTADEWYQIAYAYWGAGDRDKSHTFVSQALAANPRHADATALANVLRQGESASQTAYSRVPLPAPKGWQ